jgi:hypothetical protein
METNPNRNPSKDPHPFPHKPVQAPAAPGLPEKEGDRKSVEQVADRLAHKGAKTEQDFDRDNSKPFTK